MKTLLALLTLLLAGCGDTPTVGDNPASAKATTVRAKERLEMRPGVNPKRSIPAAKG